MGETENHPSLDKLTEPDYIKAKTGKTPADFKELVEKKGLLRPGVKAMEIVTWLKEGFGLGHGHAMAIVHALKEADSPPVSVMRGLTITLVAVGRGGVPRMITS